MEAADWVPADARSVLDVGCNAGELVEALLRRRSGLRLVGIDVNAAQIAKAKANIPGAEFYHVRGTELPFADGEFDCLTCIEVLEHIPAAHRPAALREMHRVLRVGGRLVLRVPHSGAFAWMDTNNVRFRFPRLYRWLLKRGRRDDGYAEGSDAIVWHHHFTQSELLALAGAGWTLEAKRTGALVLLPLVDLLCWPFYRLRRIENPLFRALQRVAAFDMGIDYGSLSYDILLVFRRN